MTLVAHTFGRAPTKSAFVASLFVTACLVACEGTTSSGSSQVRVETNLIDEDAQTGVQIEIDKNSDENE